MLDFLLPRSCAFCAMPVDSGSICERCHALLPRNRHACRGCANPLDNAHSDSLTCADCCRQARVFSAALAPLLYEFPVDTAIKALKFRHQLHYVPAFAGLLHEAMGEYPVQADTLVAVPLHRARHALRGFNQARELAKALSRRTGLPLFGNVRRIRATEPQSALPAARRRRNLQGAFAVHGTLPFRHPLIVDDVMTTGQTCEELARCLLRAGASEVSVLAVARARPEG
jgi:ComF family protein